MKTPSFLLSLIAPAAMLLLLPSPGQATVLVTEDFNSANLGGELIPENHPNPGDPATNTAGTPSGSPTWFINDYGVIVNDLRGVSGGKALKFRDLTTGALRADWSLPDGTSLSSGILRIGFDYQMELAAGDTLGAYPLQFATASSSKTRAFSFLLRTVDGKLRVFTTDSDSSDGTRSEPLGATADMLVNTTYRIELDLNLDTSQYGVSVYHANGDLYGTADGMDFVYDNADGPLKTSSYAQFYGGSSDIYISPDQQNTPSGLILDNVLIETIPEPTTATLLLMAGGGLLMTRRRRSVRTVSR